MTDSLADTIKAHYRSGADDLGSDFFGPCLAQSYDYARASGYFSSGAFAAWADGLMRLVAGKPLTIRLITSPQLSEADLAVFRSLEDDGERARLQTAMADQFLDDIVGLAGGMGDAAARARILAWLIAQGTFQIRFAFAEHVEDAGLFHEKIGVFSLDGGSKIAFTGSANETQNGHRRNYESVDVYRSWVAAEEDRVTGKAEQFEEAWEGRAYGLIVIPPSPAALQRLRVAGSDPGGAAPDRPSKVAVEDPRWAHQPEAVNAVLEKKHGVLEMATGTGKTRTSIRLMSHLIDAGDIDSAIITTDGTDLLEQWALELEEWALDRRSHWLVLRQFERYRQGGEYVLSPERALLIVSRSQLHRVLAKLPAATKRRTLIVHDEVHGLGTPALRKSLEGLHSAFTWRVGLSATPERAYDDAGNDFIRSELGDTIYEFPIELAIARGVLTEFDYLPLDYDLTAGDRARLQSLYARKAARQRSGSPMSNEEVWTEIARIYKTAEMKPEVYRNFLRENPETLDRSIIFVETREYGEEILELVDEYTSRYRTYYADDDREHLVEFAKGGIDCLITCHRISQGIDIRSLNSVVLFASARSRLETIQRIGRCLRVDPARPDKRALVIDFVRPAQPGDSVPNADQDRTAWLSELSKVRKGD